MRALYDVPAPGKLNLFLHITGRRADGYHLLQSVFMLIDWCDTLNFELRADGALTREDLTTALPPDDLVLRAARALQAATGTAQGAHIGVAKHLPAQAGMGGGSSDAASCLLALNRLWKLGLNGPDLERIGLALGADVPFFVFGRNAWVEGIGERLQPIALPKARFWVLKPTTGLDTASIFSAPDLQRQTKTAIIEDFAAVDSSGSPSPADMYCWGRNDMQPVAERHCPEVAHAAAWLQQRFGNSRMTGSGSAVFARAGAGDQPTATFPADELPPGWVGRLCRSLGQHPLADWAG